MSNREAIITFDTDDNGAVTGIRHANSAFYDAVSDALLTKISPNGKRLSADLQNWGERLLASAAELGALHMERDNHRTVVAQQSAIAFDHAA